MPALNVALTATQLDQLYSIIGLPESGNATFFFRTLSLYGPSSTSYSVAQIISTINAIVVTAGQAARLVTVLTQWDANNLDYSEVEISADTGTSGKISSAETQRVNIRRTIDSILCIGIPDEGFLESLKKELRSVRGAGPRMVK